jgi:hypothetical protein
VIGHALEAFTIAVVAFIAMAGAALWHPPQPRDMPTGLVRRGRALERADAVPAGTARSLRRARATVQRAVSPRRAAHPARDLLHERPTADRGEREDRRMSAKPLSDRGEVAAAMIVAIVDTLARLYNAIPPGQFMTHAQQAAVREARAMLVEHGRLPEDATLKLTDKYRRDQG